MGEEERLCKWCLKPLTGRLSQIYCSPRCGTLYRKDEAYFGGNLRNTLGWESRTCQICGKVEGKKGGFQSHHVYGRANDEEGNFLVLLCPGCHQAITLLGNRVLTEEIWERIIMYATLRKRGKEHLASVIVRVEAEVVE